MSSVNVTQLAKILVSFASFCFLYPNALSDTGRVEATETVQEERQKKA